MTDRLILGAVHAAGGWALAGAVCFLLRRGPAEVRCWAWRLALLKGPLALVFALPVAVPLPAPSPAVPAVLRSAVPMAPRSDAPRAGLDFDPVIALYLAGLVAVALARHAGPRRSFRPDMPRVVGVLRPRIFVPAGLSADAAAMAWAHEAAHVRRRDPQWSALAEAICLVFWFVPPVWLGARAMRAESEAACDAAALAETRAHPRDYAHLLLTYAGPAPANALGAPAKRLARRILMLGTPTSRLSRLSLGALLVVGLVGLTPVRAVADTRKAKAAAKKAPETTRIVRKTWKTVGKRQPNQVVLVRSKPEKWLLVETRKGKRTLVRFYRVPKNSAAPKKGKS
jgi:hypothetical protein